MIYTVNIPTSDDVLTSHVVVFDGVTYTLEIQWVPREDRYLLSLLDELGQDIFRGKVVQHAAEFFRSVADVRIPTGRLFALSLSTGLSPTQKQLGVGAECQLFYFDASEG